MTVGGIVSSMNGDARIVGSMPHTLADITPAECVGMWCEDQDGDLVILDYVYGLRVEEQEVVEALYPPTRERLEYRASELTPRFDLPRAWTPSGEPVPGEWEERVNLDVVGDSVRHTRQSRYATDWEDV